MAALDNIASELLKSANEADLIYKRTRDQAQRDKAVRLRRIVENLRNITLGASDLNGLSDVAISSPTNAQVLSYNSTTLKWQNTTISTATPTLAQVTTAGNTTTNAITVGGLTSNGGINAGSNLIGRSDWNQGIINLGGTGEIRFVNGSGGGFFYTWYQNSGGGGIERMRLSSGNNLLIGTTTDSGYKLDVNGTTRVTGTDTPGIFTVKWGTSNSITLGSNTANNPQIYLGSLSLTAHPGGSSLSIDPGFIDTTSTGTNTNRPITLAPCVMGNSTGNVILLSSGARIHASRHQPTSGVLNMVMVGGASANQYMDFAPSSGNAEFNSISIVQQINTSGTYAGIVRGIYYNPILTSVTGVTHRAIETVTGNVVFGSTSGNVLVGTTTDAGFRLDVAGIARITNLGVGAGTSTNNISGDNIAQFGNAVSSGNQFVVVDSVSGSKRGFKFGNQGTIRMALIQDGVNLQIGNYANPASFVPYVTFDYATGNVGIGTTSPFGKVDVKDGEIFVTTSTNANLRSRLTYQGLYVSRASDGTYPEQITSISSAWEYHTRNNHVFYRDGSPYFQIGTTGTASYLTIATTGNVLINTTTDSGYKLDVNGTGRFQDYLVFSAGKGIYTSTGTGNTALLSSTNYFTHTRLASSGTMGFQIGYVGSVNSFWRWNDGTGDVEFGNAAGYGMHLYTNNLSRMFINSAGNVGIGTSTPTDKFHIVDNTNGNKFGRISAGGTDASAAWVAQNDQVDNVVYRVFGSAVTGSQMGISLARSASLMANLGGSGKFLIGSYSGTDLIFGTSDQARMRLVDATGNFLIGTMTDTGNKLTVSGNIDAQGYKVNNVLGYTGILNIPTNPPGQQNIDIQGGIVINIF